MTKTPSHTPKPTQAGDTPPHNLPIDTGRADMLASLDRTARLLDTAFRVPGTSLRFGWDSIAGLIPGVGDIITLAPSALLVIKAWRMGARKRTLLHMLANTALDFTVGAIPIVGDAFDFLFKSNTRNVALLRREVEAGKLRPRNGNRPKFEKRSLKH